MGGKADFTRLELISMPPMKKVGLLCLPGIFLETSKEKLEKGSYLCSSPVELMQQLPI